MAVNEEPVLLSRSNNLRDCHLHTMPSSYLFCVTLPKPQPLSSLFPEHSVVPSIHNAFFSTGPHRSCYYQSGIRDKKKVRERERMREEGEKCGAIQYGGLAKQRADEWFIPFAFSWCVFFGGVLKEAWANVHLVLPLRAAPPTDLFRFATRHVAKSPCCVCHRIPFVLLLEKGWDTSIMAVVVASFCCFGALCNEPCISLKP